MKKKVEVGKGSRTTSHASINGMHKELMRLPNSHQANTSNQYGANDNDDFIQSESDRQMLLIKYLSLSSGVLNWVLHLSFLLYGIALLFLIDFCTSS